MGRSTAVRLECVDCKRKMSGAPADAHRRACETCGGQLRIVRYGARRKRSR